MNIKRLLADNGVRITQHRIAIAKILANSSTSLDARRIYKRLSQQRQDIGIASVYRNLALFEKSGIINRQPLPNQSASHYWLAKPSQGHVVCSHCGKTEEIGQFPELEHFREAITSHSKFATKSQICILLPVPQ